MKNNIKEDVALKKNLQVSVSSRWINGGHEKEANGYINSY